jgi:hypothetical protein
MKDIRSLCCSSFALICIVFTNPVLARTAAEVAKDINAAAKDAVRMYKQKGMAGLAAATDACYLKRTSLPYCIYFDLASKHIDDVFSDQYGMPKSPQFSPAKVTFRMQAALSTTSLNDEQKQEYVASLEPVVERLTDVELRKTGK